MLHYQTNQKMLFVHQHTIDFVGTVDHSVCSMCVPDQIHSILFTVESSFWSSETRLDGREKESDNEYFSKINQNMNPF